MQKKLGESRYVDNTTAPMPSHLSVESILVSSVNFLSSSVACVNFH